jgi:hypothetical protein
MVHGLEKRNGNVGRDPAKSKTQFSKVKQRKK